jgi:ribonuclease BN (tRNA processing enzyme)
MTNSEAKLTILGTGTCQLDPARAASSVLIETGISRVLFDIGRGICLRLSELGLKNDDIEHVVISHFHPDHVSDLIPFLHAASWSRSDPRTRDLFIYGPSGIKELVSKFIALFGPNELTREHFKVNVIELVDGSNIIANYNFNFVPLPPAGNHGLQFQFGSKLIALTGDSHFHQAEIDFLKASEIAVIDSGHLKPIEIVELACASQPSLLICSHLYRELDAMELEQQARNKGFLGRIQVAKDLEVFNF